MSAKQSLQASPVPAAEVTMIGMKQINQTQVKALEKEILLQVNKRLFDKGLITRNMFYHALEQINQSRCKTGCKA